MKKQTALPPAKPSPKLKEYEILTVTGEDLHEMYKVGNYHKGGIIRKIQDLPEYEYPAIRLYVEEVT
jgi:hypothetical protein